MKYILNVNSDKITQETTLNENAIETFLDDMLSYFHYHNKNLNAAQENFIYELERIIDNTEIYKVN